MKRQDGVELWNDACYVDLGVTADGERVYSITALGGAAMAKEAPTFVGVGSLQGKEVGMECEKVANFLRWLAGVIEGECE